VRQIPGCSLRIGHVGDLRDVPRLLDEGIRAVVELAANERPASIPRDLVHLRFPLLDGVGNPAWSLRAAVEATAGLLRSEVPTLVACGAGSSRSLAIAAAAVSVARGCPLAVGLEIVTQSGPADLSPGLWAEVRAALA
jgi:protein-tyrosine phosphatase